MPLEVVCACGNRLRVEESHAGKTIECPSCAQPLELSGRQVAAFDVFISYSSKDKTVADAAVAVLEQRGLRCWVAPRNIVAGQAWGEAIIAGIESSRLLVLIYSEHSNRSQQVVREIERAVAKGLPIIPFRIEDIPASKAMEYFISCHHWLDAYHPPLEQHLDKLASMSLRLLDESSAEDTERETAQSIAQKLQEATRTLLSRDKRSRVYVAGAALGLLAAVVIGMSAWASRDPVASGEVIQAKAAAESLAAQVAAFDPSDGFDKLQEQVRRAINEGESLFVDKQFAKAGAAFQKAIDAASTLQDWESRRSGALVEKEGMDLAEQEAVAANAEPVAKAEWGRAKRHWAEAERLYAAADYPAAGEQWKLATTAYRDAIAVAHKAGVPRAKAAAFWLGFAINNASLYSQNNPSARRSAPRQPPLFNDPWQRSPRAGKGSGDWPPYKHTVDEGLSVIQAVCREELDLSENLIQSFVAAEGSAAQTTLARRIEDELNQWYDEDVEAAYLLGINLSLLRTLVQWGAEGEPLFREKQPPKSSLVRQSFDKTLERAYQAGCGEPLIQALNDARTTWDTNLLQQYRRVLPKLDQIHQTYFANVGLLAEHFATTAPAIAPAPLSPELAQAVQAFDDTNWRTGLDYNQSPPAPRSAKFALLHDSETLDDATVQALVKLKTLKVFMTHADMTPAQLKQLSQLSGIEELWFEGVATDEHMSQLQFFPKLKRLRLKGTEVTDALAEELAKLKNITAVSLYDNSKLTKEAADKIEKLPHIKSFNFLPPGLRRPGFEPPDDYY